jgi:ABC-type polysaccharide/polyol phosphate transport system ATPase subunit
VSGEPVFRAQAVSKTFRYRPYAKGTMTLKSALLDVALFRPRPPKVTVEAVKDVSFEVPAGQAVGLIGPNGAGKSTLLRLAAGVYLPDRGKIQVRGRRGVLLDLGGGFHPDLNGYDNAEVAALVAGMTVQEFEQRIDAIVEFSELGEFMDAPLRTYSSGMQMRLGFAVASNLSPDLLIVDEVLAVGDQRFQAKCLARIRELLDGGAAMILASHSTQTVRDMCTEAIYLDQGQVVVQGPADAVCTTYEAAACAASPPASAAPSSPGDSAEPAPEERPPAEVPEGATDLPPADPGGDAHYA